IAEVANNGDYDLLLVGVGQSIFEGSLLGNILGFTTKIINPENILNQVTGKDNFFSSSSFDKRTLNILNKSKVPVGFFVNKNFSVAESVFIPIFSEKDTFLVNYAQKLINNSGSQVTLLDVTGIIKNNIE